MSPFPKLNFVTENYSKIAEISSIISCVSNFDYILKSITEIQSLDPWLVVRRKMESINDIDGAIFVEDTSLVFTALNSLPGTYIKDFVKSIGLKGLVNILSQYPDKSAKAISTIAYRKSLKSPIIFFQGTTHGNIVSPRGSSVTSFGWDSIFEEKNTGKTFAEMDHCKRTEYSHRAKAFSQLIDYIIE